MEQLIILQGVTLDQLLTRIEALVEKQINEKIQKVEPAKPFTYLSRNAVKDYLHISLPTLTEWTKMGWLLLGLGFDFLGFFSAIHDSIFVRLFQDKTIINN